jgi:hypothetical protein
MTTNEHLRFLVRAIRVCNSDKLGVDPHMLFDLLCFDALGEWRIVIGCFMRREFSVND